MIEAKKKKGSVIMAFKIGFTVQAEKKQEMQETCFSTKEARRSLVTVRFQSRNCSYTYYNDRFDLHEGDRVFVEGKMEGVRGEVTQVSYSFKIKPTDYQQVIGVADTHVKGEFLSTCTHFITRDRQALPFEQAQTWFMPPIEGEWVSGEAGEPFSLNNLQGFEIDPRKAERGCDYYMQNRVVYLELKDGKVRAIVDGSAPYVVEFDYHKGMVSNITCNCYCVGACKHQMATLLQLRDILDSISDVYDLDPYMDYLAAIAKPIFVEQAFGSKPGGVLLLQ
jgi:hypothetical protein